MPTVTCKNCSKSVEIAAWRAKRFVHCSYACRDSWKTKHSGPNNLIYVGNPTTKTCEYCGNDFTFKIGTYTSFKKQRFCSMRCAGLGCRSGSDGEKRLKKMPREGHAKWARQVISRDKATCQNCGAFGVEVQAHHILDYLSYPTERTNIANGITLCAPCHWNVHAKSEENGVNCWKIRLEIKDSKDNQQPSIERKFIEGSTTSGRSYRRIETSCAECGKFLSKRASDILGKDKVYCDRVCAGKARSKQMTGKPRLPRK